MKYIQVVVVAIIKKGDNYLLTLRNESNKKSKFHNKWQLPGGGLEFGEKPEETVVRECREELGVEVEVEKMLPKVFSSVRKTWHGVLLFYFCKMKDQNKPIIVNDEASAFKWAHISEIPTLKSLPLVKEIFDEIKKLR